jgi:hypothetical protein
MTARTQARHANPDWRPFRELVSAPFAAPPLPACDEAELNRMRSEKLGRELYPAASRLMITAD